MTQNFYKTVFSIEVLSDEPLYEPLSLTDIHYLITEGPCSGRFLDTAQEVVTRERMEKLLIQQGSDPEFLLGDDVEELPDDCGIEGSANVQSI